MSVLVADLVLRQVNRKLFVLALDYFLPLKKDEMRHCKGCAKYLKRQVRINGTVCSAADVCGGGGLREIHMARTADKKGTEAPGFAWSQPQKLSNPHQKSTNTKIKQHQ